MKKIWAIGDLHLSFGVPEKGMDLFGIQWKDHPEKIRTHWCDLIRAEDLVLLPGDISWAMKPEEAKVDLEWIHQLPGTKVMIRGNHDYWWGSLNKVKQVLPPSIHAIQNNSMTWEGVGIAGARLWDTPEYKFNEVIEYVERPKTSSVEPPNTEDEAARVFQRELGRFELSLQSLPKETSLRLAMTHYPPIGLKLAPSEASALLEKHRINICVFGHLHSLKKGLKLFGSARNVRYELTSCDYLDFSPLLIHEI